MSTQDQNTPQQKDARPIWTRLRAKATAEAVQPQHYTRPQHYSKADMLKQSNIWFRKQGVPLIIPARQRALDAFPRSVPWILWAGIMHICYIFLRDILLFVVEDVKGSLPNYIKALTSDSALSNEVLPVLVLGGIFLVMPVISGVFIALAHVLMVRTPRWVQITTVFLPYFLPECSLPPVSFHPTPSTASTSSTTVPKYSRSSLWASTLPSSSAWTPS